jgi:hypothetical protein
MAQGTTRGVPIDTDPLLANNSDLLVPSQKAVKTYVDTSISQTVTSVAALTLGTTGTDLSSTVANSTTTPVITLNVPDASTTARGVITTGAQTMAGGKTFTLGNQVAGWGAIGISDNNDNENNYAGIKGLGLQYSNGVWGTATDGIGVYGTATNGVGIVAKSTSSYHAVLGDFSSNSTYITNSGRVLIKTNVDNTLDALQVNGNIKADNTRYIIKSTGATNSTTTLATCGLNTPTLTAGTYRFSILIAYNAATTGTGARFVIDGTGTAPTNLNFSVIRTLTATTQQPNFGSAYLVPATATATSLTTGNICKIEGVITLPSTAVLSVKFASSTTSAITVLAGSYFEYF